MDLYMNIVCKRILYVREMQVNVREMCQIMFKKL